MSSNKKILFLSFNPLFSKGGHSKNFLNLVKHIEPEIRRNQFRAFIISYNNTPDEKAGNVDQISKTSFLNTYRVRILKRFFPSGRAIFQAMEYVLNFIKTIALTFVYRPDVVYAYADKPLFIIFPLKKILRFKLIYDIRGDILDEHKARGASKRKLSILSKVQSKAPNSVDLAFSVSSAYNLNNINPKLKIVPKYNYYDGEIFRYNRTQMLEKKKELKLEDKFIFVYNGNTHYYQFLDGTVKFFAQFLEKHNDSFFIIISEHDASRLISLLHKYCVPQENYFIKSLPQNRISEVQQTADISFLLREDLPLNHHSFPTKFAEYLASGVPVLMTPHIHSIAPMVIQNDLGEVIEIKNDYSSEIEKVYIKFKNNLGMKDHCSKFAQTELMWQNKAISLFEIIKSV